MTLENISQDIKHDEKKVPDIGDISIVQSYINPKSSKSLISWLELRRQIVEDEEYLTGVNKSISAMTSLILNFVVILIYFIFDLFFVTKFSLSKITALSTIQILLLIFTFVHLLAIIFTINYIITNKRME